LEQYIEVNINNVVINILQGSAITETLSGGLNIRHQLANFIYCTKNYKSWLVTHKVIARIIKKVTFFGPWCKYHQLVYNDSI